MKNEIIKCFNLIDEKLDGKVIEISVKQSRIQFCFEDSVSIKSCLDINGFFCLFDVTNITTFQDHLFVDVEKNDNFSEDKVDEKSFYGLILKLKGILCSCPVLEYVVSNNYIKIFLDLPHVTVEDLVNVDNLMDSVGIIEFVSSRPYLLYVQDGEL